LFAQKKRNKEKGAFSEEFFRQQGRKTIAETPRRSVPPLLISELSATILRIRIFDYAYKLSIFNTILNFNIN